jgi:hypothetical protein
MMHVGLARRPRLPADEAAGRGGSAVGYRPGSAGGPSVDGRLDGRPPGRIAGARGPGAIGG